MMSYTNTHVSLFKESLHQGPDQNRLPLLFNSVVGSVVSTCHGY